MNKQADHFNVHTSPRHVFSCACGREITDVRPSPRYLGIETVSTNGRVCCSEYEGDFKNSDGSFDVEGAEEQAAMSREHMVSRSWDGGDWAAYADNIGEIY